MTRNSDVPCLAVFTFLGCLGAPVCAATESVTDAFGIFRSASPTEPLRANWAGLREVLAPMGARAETIAPGPVETILLQLGGKSLSAGGPPAESAALLFDAAGNSVADDTPVALTAGTTDPRVVATQNGIASRLISPGRAAGLFHAGAASGNRQGPRAEYQIVSNVTSITPQIIPQTEPALPETMTTLALPMLLDRDGNAVEDGIGLTLLATHADGSYSLVPAVTTGGRAEARILTRNLPQQGAVTAALTGHRSGAQPFRVAMLQPVGLPEVVARALDDAVAHEIRIGPFLTQAGHLLNDGADIAVTLTTSSGRQLRTDGWLADGMFRTVQPIVRDDFPLDLTVTTSLGTVSLTVAQPGAGR
ncbi:MAG: hypothetical protein V4804_18120 [Pseudomonadota bacterium]